MFAASLEAQILTLTPGPATNSTPSAVHVPPILSAPTAYPAAIVPSVASPTGLGMPSPYRTSIQPAILSSGSPPASLPNPQMPPSSSLSAPNPSLLTSKNNGLLPSAILGPSGTTPIPTPSILPTVTPPAHHTPSRTVSLLPAGQALSIPRIRIAKTMELENSNAPKMTLDDAVKFALAHNPDILNSVEQIRIMRGQYISVRAQLLPQLVATGSFGGKQTDLLDPPQPKRKVINSNIIPTDLGELSGSAINNSWNIQIAVQQLVFDGGGALSQTCAAQYVQDQSYFTLRSVIDRVISQVKVAFFQVILHRALIVVQEQSVALLENQSEDQESRYQVGTVPKFNVLQAQVAVANAVPPLITARNNLRIAQYQLVKILGMNYQGDPTRTPFNVIGDLTVNFRKIIPDESIRIGLTRNPSLKAQRENILSQAVSITAALSGYYPRIIFGAGYIAQNNPNFQYLGSTIEGWFFGFNGTWNIFDGLNTYGKVTTAKAQLAQAKIGYDNSVRSVILEIQQDISYLQQAQETLESQQASVVQATEALRLARERLDAGSGTQLDVLNAQVALLQAQTTVLQAKFNYLQALAQYDAALSLSTQYVETFRDPLESKEKWRFARLNGAGYKMPPLPRVYRDQNPVRPILGPTPASTPSSLPHKYATRSQSQRSISYP